MRTQASKPTQSDASGYWNVVVRRRDWSPDYYSNPLSTCLGRAEVTDWCDANVSEYLVVPAQGRIKFKYQSEAMMFYLAFM